jgi:acetoin utilization protein AcuC
MSAACVYIGEELARYGFGEGHPFGPDRLGVFWQAAQSAGLESRVTVCPPVMADRNRIERFHTAGYVDRVIGQSATGSGYLDLGDTPAFPGVYEAAAYVVGSVLDAIDQVVAGRCGRALGPFAALNQAGRPSAPGFCVFNDCGVAIETLRSVHGLRRVAYVDIDAHHGDGVFYAFEDDPDLIFADLHEDGRYLYPGTGDRDETGTGAGQGTKLNLPMDMQAGDEAFFAAWERAEAFVDAHRPEFILLQCGADSIAGDPITHLQYTAAAHAHAARRLCALADRHCGGRLLALGGGGYNRDNLARAWTAVLAELADAGQ